MNLNDSALAMLEFPSPTSPEVTDTNNTPTLLDLDEVRVASPAFPKVMKLNVGGRIFTTSPNTLSAESGLFKRQLSESYTWTPEIDGSYFLDADPDLFEHLISYMRRPSVFPLFYNQANGFDYTLYNRLQDEALYFQMDALHVWIKEKKYLEAVIVKTGFPSTRNIKTIFPTQTFANKSEEWHIVHQTKKVYLCPRQIAAHKGQPEKCGGACHRRQAENVVEYEDEVVLEVISVEKEIIFDERVCRAE